MGSCEPPVARSRPTEAADLPHEHLPAVLLELAKSSYFTSTGLGVVGHPIVGTGHPRRGAADGAKHLWGLLLAAALFSLIEPSIGVAAQMGPMTGTLCYNVHNHHVPFRPKG